MSEKRDWDEVYRQGETPWDSGIRCSELVKIIEEEIVTSGHALDLGCGTGTNVIFLAGVGFDATGVDISRVAISRAMEKAAEAGVKATFTVADLPGHYAPGRVFDFIFDRGCFHTIVKDDRTGYLDMLKRLTRAGSIYLMLCGNAKEPQTPGPPTMTEEEIREVFSPLFDFIWLRDFRFDTTGTMPAPLGYSCLMRRREA